eukprot:6204365-Pleurochrysis_carterae.AAC.1
MVPFISETDEFPPSAVSDHSLEGDFYLCDWLTVWSQRARGRTESGHGEDRIARWASDTSVVSLSLYTGPFASYTHDAARE